MHRRNFLSLGAIGVGGIVLPSMFAGKVIAAEDLVSTLDVRIKKALADVAMAAATRAGASYCDVRVGRYLRQFVITREANVQNIVNTESTGVGVRVIADGAWGFAATNAMTSGGCGRRCASGRHHCQGQRQGVDRARPAGTRDRRGRGELANPDREERDGSADRGEGRAADGRQRRGDRGGRQLRPVDAVPRQRAEIFRQYRRLLHRSGRASDLGTAEW